MNCIRATTMEFYFFVILLVIGTASSSQKENKYYRLATEYIENTAKRISPLTGGLDALGRLTKTSSRTARLSEMSKIVGESVNNGTAESKKAVFALEAALNKWKKEVEATRLKGRHYDLFSYDYYKEFREKSTQLSHTIEYKSILDPNVTKNAATLEAIKRDRADTTNTVSMIISLKSKVSVFCINYDQEYERTQFYGKCVDRVRDLIYSCTYGWISDVRKKQKIHTLCLRLCWNRDPDERLEAFMRRYKDCTPDDIDDHICETPFLGCPLRDILYWAQFQRSAAEAAAAIINNELLMFSIYNMITATVVYPSDGSWSLDLVQRFTEEIAFDTKTYIENMMNMTWPVIEQNAALQVLKSFQLRPVLIYAKKSQYESVAQLAQHAMRQVGLNRYDYNVVVLHSYRSTFRVIDTLFLCSREERCITVSLEDVKISIFISRYDKSEKAKLPAAHARINSIRHDVRQIMTTNHSLELTDMYAKIRQQVGPLANESLFSTTLLFRDWTSDSNKCDLVLGIARPLELIGDERTIASIRGRHRGGFFSWCSNTIAYFFL